MQIRHVGTTVRVPSLTGDPMQTSYLATSRTYNIAHGKIVTELVGTPIEITVYKMGDKYIGARSNELGTSTTRSPRRWWCWPHRNHEGARLGCRRQRIRIRQLRDSRAPGVSLRVESPSPFDSASAGRDCSDSTHRRSPPARRVSVRRITAGSASRSFTCLLLGAAPCPPISRAVKPSTGRPAAVPSDRPHPRRPAPASDRIRRAVATARRRHGDDGGLIETASARRSSTAKPLAMGLDKDDTIVQAPDGAEDGVPGGGRRRGARADGRGAAGVVRKEHRRVHAAGPDHLPPHVLLAGQRGASARRDAEAGLLASSPEIPELAGRGRPSETPSCSRSISPTALPTRSRRTSVPPFAKASSSRSPVPGGARSNRATDRTSCTWTH